MPAGEMKGKIRGELGGGMFTGGAQEMQKGRGQGKGERGEWTVDSGQWAVLSLRVSVFGKTS